MLESEIDCLADFLIRLYGADADAEAERKVREKSQNSDAIGYVRWSRIQWALARLQRRRDAAD